MARKYVAFISYRHAELDSAVAKQLHSLIEQYVIPKNLRKGEKKLGIVFRDQEELPVSSDLSDDICRALDNAQFLIVVCSKNTAHSPWVGREISYFLSHHDRSRALAVLASGEPVDVFPKALTEIHHEDGTITEVEPLAVDVRADSIPAMKKKLKREITRLYAALIGCPYDALVMREQRRKRRQLASIMAVIMAIVTSFSAMTLVKNHQIDQKNEELAGMNQTLEGKNQELEEKNEELARQKAEVQLRESELLTEKGLAALETADSQAALENFLSALPNQEEDRPYYALAEQGLTSTLGFYSENRSDTKVFNTVLQQKSPIAAYEISPDGTRVMTLDNYSVVTCYDTASGETLWTCQVNDSSYVDNMQMIPYPETNSIIIFTGYTITSVAWEDGAQLWTYQAESSTNLYISPDRETVAFYSDRFTEDFAHYEHSYIFLSPKTGEKKQTICLGLSDTSMYDLEDELPYWSFSDTSYVDRRTGTFSSDSRYFAFSFIAYTSDTEMVMQYGILDLEMGTSQIIYGRQRESGFVQEEVIYLQFVDEDAALVSVERLSGGNAAMRAEKIDLQTGKRLWTLDTPEEETYYYTLTGDRPLYFVGENYLFLCRGEWFHVYDLQTGELIHSTHLTGRVVSMERVGDLFFSLVFADGRYTMAWANIYGVFCADTYYGGEINLGTAAGSKIWNEGALRLVVENDSIQSYSIGTDGEYGFVVVQPEAESTSLKVKRLVSFGEQIETTQVDIMPEKGTMVDGVAEEVGNYLIAGRFSNYAEETSVYSYRRVDMTTREVTDIVLDEFVLTTDIYFTSDGSGYITVESTKGIVYHNTQEGKKTVLMENSSIPFPDYPDQTHFEYTYSAAVQTADERLLTVSLGRGELVYWMDGKEKTVVPIPEDITPELVKGTNWSRFLLAGRNGYILLADYGDGEDLFADYLVAYNIANGQWYRIKTERDATSAFVSMSKVGTKMLMCDDSNVVYLYDIVTGVLEQQFPLQLPLNSVDQIFLFAKDQYILVKTIDLHVFIYDIGSGQIVYDRQIEGYASGNVQTAVDEKNNRLYFWDDSDYDDMGYCIDMDSWTELAEIFGLMYYDTDTNEVYCYDSTLWDYLVFRAPSLEELVAIGEELLQR